MPEGHMQISPGSQVDPQLEAVPDLPPEPHCVTWYSGSPCDVLKQQYQIAVEKRQGAELRNFVKVKQGEAANLAAAQTSAPLQQQISALQDQNGELQTQLQQLRAQTQQQLITAIQAKEAAHDEGFREGLYRGIGVVLVIVLMAVAIT